jgi:hypothetical protein
MLDYECILVEANSDHRLAKYVQDDEDLFVVLVGTPEWWLADSFFAIRGEMSFTQNF